MGPNLLIVPLQKRQEQLGRKNEFGIATSESGFERLDGAVRQWVSRIPFGEFRFLRDIGRAFEVERVSVGVLDDSDPHIVADLRLAGLDAARRKFAVQGDSILALIADAYALARVVQRRAGVVAFCAELLEHDGDGVAFEPAPLQLAVGRPLLFQLEAEARDVEADRILNRSE